MKRLYLLASIVAVALIFTGFNPVPTADTATRDLGPRPEPPTTHELRNCHTYGETHNLHTAFSLQTNKCIALTDQHNTHPVQVK